MSLSATDPPRRHRLSVADYYRMAEVGMLAVRGQNPVLLSDLSEPQPDVALLRRREDFYREHRPGPADTLLVVEVVEVADSSLRFDRETKMRLYARHEIPEAWLVDLRGRRLDRYRAPDQGAYTLVDEPDLHARLDVATLPGLAIDLRRLFG